MKQRVPTMGEMQAMVAYQDAVRRLRIAGHTVENRRMAGGDIMSIRVASGDPVDFARNMSFAGVEGRARPIHLCFQDAADWLEMLEGQLGRMPLVEILERLTLPGLDDESRLVLHRAKMRYAEGDWWPLERAYLHRVFLWPATTHPENRHARRAAGRTFSGG